MLESNALATWSCWRRYRSPLDHTCTRHNYRDLCMEQHIATRTTPWLVDLMTPHGLRFNFSYVRATIERMKFTSCAVAESPLSEGITSCWSYQPPLNGEITDSSPSKSWIARSRPAAVIYRMAWFHRRRIADQGSWSVHTPKSKRWAAVRTCYAWFYSCLYIP